jgi:hypothetical protein
MAQQLALEWTLPLRPARSNPDVMALLQGG